MKFFEQIIKIAKKTTLLEKIVFILLLCLTVITIFNRFFKREGFANNSQKELIKKQGDDIFDKYYVSIYDDLVYNKVKNDFEIGTIINNTKPTSKSIVLDIGCGTGHHVNLFNLNNISNVIGIDNSVEMIEKARENYPESNFKVCNALNTMEFSSDSFTHITCLYFTIYYIKNKKQFLENCFRWLKSGGVLVLHLVNSKEFDPIVPIAYESGFKNNKNNKNNTNNLKKRTTKSEVKFTTMKYIADFTLDERKNANTIIMKQPNAVFKETFKFNDSKSTRINEHNLYMSTQKSILAAAREIGFIMRSIKEMNSIDYHNNFLYTLEKP